ncbi:MAG: lipid-A-disaccharide synthase [Bacteroidota bacterium]|nr:lipid-A-disaccharide synthase [Bacteroidota bacterium]
MYYYLIAGERSGDLHGSNLMREIKLLDSEAKFRFWGGDYMKEQGGTLVRHYSHMNFMGVIDVILNIPKVLLNLKKCQNDLLRNKPDVIILIDFSGFNMRIAKFAHQNNLLVYYYISPKIWAWNRNRAFKIKEYIKRMFVILPFEKDFYKQYDFEVDYVGNPVLDAIRSFVPNPDFKKQNNLDERPVLAILPGSRKTEVEDMLHFMVSIMPAFRNYQLIIAGVSNLDRNYYEHFRREGFVSIIYDQTYDLLAHAEVALVTSGTATLETALFKVPQVVCYATNTLTYMIGRPFVKIKYISLPNLIADKEIIPELIQDRFSPINVIEELLKITEDSNNRKRMLNDYEELSQKMGKDEASKKTASLIVKYLKEDSNK